MRARRLAVALLGVGVLLSAAPRVRPAARQLIPNLFGGTLSTTIDQTVARSSRQQVHHRQPLPQPVGAALAGARSSVPIPSSSGAFSFAWDRELDTFVRSEQSLGSIFAERAQTLGRGRFNVGLSYQHVDFDTLDGEPLSNIRSLQPAFTRGVPRYADPGDATDPFGDDQIAHRAWRSRSASTSST